MEWRKCRFGDAVESGAAQLIDATLEAINEVGMHDATIAQIARRAGVSPGSSSHYFSTKWSARKRPCAISPSLRDAVSEIDYVQLRRAVAEQRLQAIVGGTFDETQVSSAAMKAWLAFWASRYACRPILCRLQQVSSRRLLSNLVSNSPRVTAPTGTGSGLRPCRVVDGLWLHAALSGKPLDKPLRTLADPSLLLLSISHRLTEET
ncbi:transcriptional regulator BetI [Escherichia coli]